MIVNRYRIEDEIGKGGMGTVYKGVDTQSGQIVAIKHLKTELTSPELIERFRREGEALRELNHPNIVKMLDTVEENGDYYLIIEYLPGGDLSDLLKQGQLPLEKMLQMAIDICDALTRAHRLNIIHRDLKPANVLIAADGTPRLADFGVAHFVEKTRITESDAIIGTIDYLAPEIIKGEQADTLTDIWAFGVMLFEMLTGIRPFTGSTRIHTFYSIAREPVPDLELLRPDISVALVDLIYRMLEKDRYRRVPSIRVAGVELESLLKGFDWQPAAIMQQTNRFSAQVLPSDEIKHNLPIHTTPFVGRETELAELRRLLSDSKIRLITILAPGGMGKSRLALELAQQTLANFANGVFLAELAPLRSADDIVSTIATTVGFQFYGGDEPKTHLLNFFRTKNMLLVLDNYEHLLDGAALAREILEVAPQVKIVTTSRVKLNVAGETLFTIGGMDFPDWETPADALRYSAVQLFMQSAHHVQPQFELTTNNMDYVARICRLVGGMPLGIELAAAWLSLLTPQEVAEEIQSSPDFLEAQGSEHPERQRNIRVVFDYSWNLLNAAERAVLMKLTVFRGSFSRNAAQTVTQASLRDLMALVNKSLLHRDADTGKFTLHELLRQYAEEHLQQADMVDASCDAHSAYYLMMLDKRELELISPTGIAYLDDIEADMENIRAALLWAAQYGHYAHINGALHSIWAYFWLSTAVAEFPLFEQAVQAIRKQTATIERDITLLHLLLRQSDLYSWTGTVDLAKTCLHEAESLINDATPLPIQALFFMERGLSQMLTRGPQGDIRVDVEEIMRWRADYEKAITLHRQLGNIWGEAETLHWLSGSYWVSPSPDDVQMAPAIIQPAIELLRAHGDVLWLSGALMDYANALVGQSRHNFEKAKELYFEALGYAERAKLRFAVSGKWANLAWLYASHHRLEEAITFQKKAVAIVKDFGNQHRTASHMTSLSYTYFELGQYTQAQIVAEEALQVVEGKFYHDVISGTCALLTLFYGAVGDNDKALQYARRALAVVDENSAIVNSGWVNLRVGLFHLWREAWLLAREHLEQSIQSLQAYATDIYEINTYLLQVFYKTGDYATVLEKAPAIIDYARAADNFFKVEMLIALAQATLGQTLCALGRITEVQSLVVDALVMAQSFKRLWLQGTALLAFATWLGAAGYTVRAVEVASFIQSEPRFIAPDKRDATRLLNALQGKLSPTNYQTATKSGKVLELETVIQALWAEFGAGA